MTRIKIGDWVRGYRRWRVTRIHHVDSTVADDVFTQCGRRLRGDLGRLQVAAFIPAGEKCRVCK